MVHLTMRRGHVRRGRRGLMSVGTHTMLARGNGTKKRPEQKLTKSQIVESHRLAEKIIAEQKSSPKGKKVNPYAVAVAQTKKKYGVR